MIIKSYSELITFLTFEERYEYLRLKGKVGFTTFGCDRYLNQMFYNDYEWLSTRDKVILRDNACDLGIPDREIKDIIVNGKIVRPKIIVHHINPITKEDILRRDPKLFDMENLICTIKRTHDAIHYGDSELLIKDPIERKANDTCPWRK